MSLRSIVALIAPPLCSACRRPCAASSFICAHCRGELNAQPRAGRAAVPYDGVARKLVIALKRDGQVAVAQGLAQIMLERHEGELAGAEWIVPAPSHPSRSRGRGYSPSLLIARELARLSGTRCIDCLVRSPDRAPQSELTRAERLAMPGAHIGISGRALRRHGIDPLAALPTNVVVCDDVTTTGVTLERCAQAIRERQQGAAHRPLGKVVFAAA